MNKIFLLLVCLFYSYSLFAESGFSISTSNYKDYKDTYINSSDGSLQVFVVDSLSSESSLSFKFNSNEKLSECSWFSFDDYSNKDSLSSFSINADSSVMLNVPLTLNKGYTIKFVVGDTTLFRSVWLSTYSPINSITWNNDTTFCDRLPLQISPCLYYKDFNNVNRSIKRSLQLTYDVFEMESGDTISSKTTSQTADSILYLSSVPTVNTSFEVVEDGYEGSYITDTFYTKSVNAFPSFSTADKVVNEIESSDYDTDEEGNAIFRLGESSEFRTSGPLYLNLKANSSPYSKNCEWQISTDSSFTKYYTIYNKPNIFNYKFSEQGTHCIKYLVYNNDSTCDYEIAGCFKICAPDLKIPNTFTPNGDGFNDLFLVEFASMSSFECRIYNQWGRKVFDTNDIKQGWDGKDNGKECPTGVYFYVIKASGVDGSNYDKNGTINLLRSAK